MDPRRTVVTAASGVVLTAALIASQSQVVSAQSEIGEGGAGKEEITVASDDRRADLQNTSTQISQYSERSILELLLAGTGKIVAENPGIEDTLGFHPDRQMISDDDLRAVVTAYLEFNPNFSDQYLPGITSGNPEAVEPALAGFYETVIEFFETDPIFEYTREAIGTASDDAVLRSGTAQNVQNVNAAVNINAAVNAITVAAGGAAVVAVAFVLVAVVYLDNDPATASNNVDRSTMIRELSTALS